MSKVSCVSGGKAPKVPLRMARAELLHFADYFNNAFLTHLRVSD